MSIWRNLIINKHFKSWNNENPAAQCSGLNIQSRSLSVDSQSPITLGHNYLARLDNFIMITCVIWSGLPSNWNFTKLVHWNGWVIWKNNNSKWCEILTPKGENACCRQRCIFWRWRHENVRGVVCFTSQIVALPRFSVLLLGSNWPIRPLRGMRWNIWGLELFIYTDLFLFNYCTIYSSHLSTVGIFNFWFESWSPLQIIINICHKDIKK